MIFFRSSLSFKGCCWVIFFSIRKKQPANILNFLFRIFFCYFCLGYSIYECRYVKDILVVFFSLEIFVFFFCYRNLSFDCVMLVLSGILLSFLSQRSCWITFVAQFRRCSFAVIARFGICPTALPPMLLHSFCYTPQSHTPVMLTLQPTTTITAAGVIVTTTAVAWSFCHHPPDEAELPPLSYFATPHLRVCHPAFWRLSPSPLSIREPPHPFFSWRRRMTAAHCNLLGFLSICCCSLTCLLLSRFFFSIIFPFPSFSYVFFRL